MQKINIFTQKIKHEKLINIILEFINADNAIDLDQKKYAIILQKFKKENPEYLQGNIALIINNQDFLNNPVDVSKNNWEYSQKKLHLYNNLWFLAPLIYLNIKNKISDPDTVDTEFYKGVRNIIMVTNYDVESIIFIWSFLTILQEIIVYKFYKNNDNKYSLLNIRKKIYKICQMLLPTCQSHMSQDFNIGNIFNHEMFWLADLIGKFTHLAKTGDLDQEKILTKVNHNIFCEIILNVWYADLNHLCIH